VAPLGVLLAEGENIAQKFLKWLPVGIKEAKIIWSVFISAFPAVTNWDESKANTTEVLTP